MSEPAVQEQDPEIGKDDRTMILARGIPADLYVSTRACE